MKLWMMFVRDLQVVKLLTPVGPRRPVSEGGARVSPVANALYSWPWPSFLFNSLFLIRSNNKLHSIWPLEIMLTDTNDVILIEPTPHFTVKTRLVQPSGLLNYLPNTKLFTNICSSSLVPPPSSPFQPPETYKLIMSDQWEIPIVTSSHRLDTDKKGDQCIVFDCVINSDAMRWVQNDKQLREIVIEWCLESVEVRSECTLDREKISIPKMVSKGKPGVVEWVREDQSKEQGGVSEISELLDMKRIVEENDDNLDTNVELLGPSVSNGRKPLIQEINELTIEPKKQQSLPIRKTTQAEGSTKLKYATTMRKVDTESGHKLMIEITSQNSSSLDYDLSLDHSTKSLVLKNMNPQVEAKDLILPLPTMFQNPEIKSFFIKREQKLVVLVK